jgi:hypothetical protein
VLAVAALSIVMVVAVAPLRERPYPPTILAPPSAKPPVATIEANGVSMTVPAGWHGRVLPATSILQVANFPSNPGAASIP